MFRLIGAIIFSLVFVLFMGTRIVQDIAFDRDCGGYLKRAADANTVPLAMENLQTALQYIKRHELTSGYTSVWYTTPDEDVGFWQKNIASSLEELKQVRAETTPLERTNLLMKLRETLLDEGEGTSVTLPSGISIFPFNVAYWWWGIASSFAAIAFWFSWFRDEYHL